MVIFSLSVGTVLDAAFNPYLGKETGETGMLRTLMYSLKRGDVLLGDRYFANYWIIGLATLLGLEVVFRQHQLRKVDFRKGRRLGQNDHRITWEKPKPPKWMPKFLRCRHAGNADAPGVAGADSQEQEPDTGARRGHHPARCRPL